MTLVKNRLDFTQNLVKTELKAVGEYRRGNNGTGQKLGKDWEGGDYLGDKSWFAAGYEYEVGWEVEPTKKKDGLVCELKGSAHGDMGFDAWIVGSTIHVVEGAVRAEANPGTNGGDARVNAHLKMFDQAVFNTDGWKLAQTFHPDDDGTFAKQIPGFKPRFDIYVGVPISGQLWGELMFGSSLDVSGKTSMECQTELPKFAVNATYMPFFGAFGLGQVGVGIAGVASAGIRASLTLIMLGLPVNVGMKTSIKNGKPKVTFGSDLGLMLATLGGRVSLYVEFLMFDEEFELFRWKGFSTTVPIMPRLEADVSLVGLK